MSKEVYKRLIEILKKRGRLFVGMDIPEFFALVEELFTPEEAEVNNAMPEGPVTAKDMASEMNRDEAEIKEILETMADKGLCISVNFGEIQYYQAAPFAPGILEFQFMPGKKSERDKKLAKLIHTYRNAYLAKIGPIKLTFPRSRVITVDRVIDPENTVHTYDQVQTYIDKYDPIAASTCYCRHEAALLGEDTHGVPMEVCMTFGLGAQYTIERLGARKLSKKEARELLDQTEEAGLIHTSTNTTEDINFLCNCDRWNCAVIKTVLTQSNPGLFLNSGFQPRVDPDICAACETCIERCPASARSMTDNNVSEVNLDRCFGCAVCATGCPSGAIVMESKPGFREPPKDEKALSEAIRASSR